jgi:glycerol-3-phosphate dehydrogenase
LTLAFVKSAVHYGADVANYTMVEDFLRESGRVNGVLVRDMLSGKTIPLHGKITLNCCGPWADILLAVARGTPGSQQIRRSEGIHIITRHPLTKHGAIGATTPSGRPCNLIPWRGHTLIGTTDREYVGDPDAYCVTREKIEQYVAEINQSFGKDLVKYSDIIHVYGGLRPLIDDQTTDVYKTSRKYEIFDHEQDGLAGLITVEGGKYTTSRNLAENVLKTVNMKFGRRNSRSITARKRLAGCDIPDMNAFVAAAKAAYRDFPEKSVDFLARIYGTALPEVMGIALSDKQYASPLDADGELPAQVVYAIRQEMACTLMDILVRRTGIGTLGNPGKDVIEIVAGIAASELKWDKARMEGELAAAEKALSLPT